MCNCIYKYYMTCESLAVLRSKPQDTPGSIAILMAGTLNRFHLESTAKHLVAPLHAAGGKAAKTCQVIRLLRSLKVANLWMPAKRRVFSFTGKFLAHQTTRKRLEC